MNFVSRFSQCSVLVAVVIASISIGRSGPPPEPPPPEPAPPECDDFITGGGWITGTPSGENGSFGVHGGVMNGELWGHLNFIDHATEMHVKSTVTTGYSVVPGDSDCRVITFDVEIDGTPGTAKVTVCDRGEPGRDDTFEVELSNGYIASGDLGGNRPGGGNLQLHKGKCK